MLQGLIIFIVLSTIIYGETPSIPNVRQGTVVSEDDDSWRFIVSLQYASQYYCGGSLIAPRWILTSASCLTDKKNNSPYVSDSYDKAGMGSYNLANISRYDIRRFIRHPHYNHTTHENDIGLVELERPITNIVPINYMTIDIPQPAPLSESILKLKQSLKSIPTYQQKISGWGRVNDNMISPSQLHEGMVYSVPNSDCNRTYEDITNTMFCAWGKEVLFCGGDTGGPLIQNNTLLGIASRGRDCNDINNPAPDVYTKVSKYVYWIGSQGLDSDHDGIRDDIDSDDDNDGISDYDENSHGLNPLNPSDAQIDADDDGFSNLVEYIAGADMYNAESQPVWVPILSKDIVMLVPYFNGE